MADSEALFNSFNKKIRRQTYPGFLLGMIGEIRKLKWSYIDREKRFIRLPKEVTEEGKAKTIPINHHEKTALDNTPRHINHGYVIAFDGQPILQKDGMKRSFKTACKNAKVAHGRRIEGGITFHDIRRTVKTNMLNAGVDRVRRDLILGHSLQGMDVYYMVGSDEMLAQVMERYRRYRGSGLHSSLFLKVCEE